MSDSDPVRARLDSLEGSCTECCPATVGEFLDALRAVLDLCDERWDIGGSSLHIPKIRRVIAEHLGVTDNV